MLKLWCGLRIVNDYCPFFLCMLAKFWPRFLLGSMQFGSISFMFLYNNNNDIIIKKLHRNEEEIAQLRNVFFFVHVNNSHRSEAERDTEDK